MKFSLPAMSGIEKYDLMMYGEQMVNISFFYCIVTYIFN
jgi:hypothetical protein